MLIVDKQRPKTLVSMDYHKNISENLIKMVCEWSCCFHLQAASGDIPHILFYGPSGAGKKTRIMALLREMFGNGVEKVYIGLYYFNTQLRMEKREFKVVLEKVV